MQGVTHSILGLPIANQEHTYTTSLIPHSDLERQVLPSWFFRGRKWGWQAQGHRARRDRAGISVHQAPLLTFVAGIGSDHRNLMLFPEPWIEHQSRIFHVLAVFVLRMSLINILENLRAPNNFRNYARLHSHKIGYEAGGRAERAGVASAILLSHIKTLTS